MNTTPAKSTSTPNLKHWSDQQLIQIMHNANVSRSGRMAAAAELNSR